MIHLLIPSNLGWQWNMCLTCAIWDAPAQFFLQKQIKYITHYYGLSLDTVGNQ